VLSLQLLLPLPLLALLQVVTVVAEWLLCIALTPPLLLLLMLAQLLWLVTLPASAARSRLSLLLVTLPSLVH
jgi:hypothetical protein